MFNTEHLQEKWQPVLEHNDLPEIKDSYRRAVTTVILENQEKHFVRMEDSSQKLHQLTQQVVMLIIGIRS
jgi:hypothetical protein